MAFSKIVTVGVTTFNSEEFIEDTLESIRVQSYKEIELIISDDASTDNTLRVCDKWLKKYESRFVKVQVLTVTKNSGVSANCKRVIMASNSEWIKFIAGDDILLPSCIEENMSYIAENPEVQVVFSQVKLYKEKFKEELFLRDVPSAFPKNLMHPKFSSQDQFELLLLSDRITYTPSYFFNKRAILEVGGYDESNNKIEDYPMWLKLTKAGYKLHYFHKPTVGYRMHYKALNNNAWQGTVKPDFKVIHKMRRSVAHPNLPWEIVAKENFIFIVSLLFSFFNLHNRLGPVKRIHHFIAYYLNPFTYIYFIKKKLPRRHLRSHFYDNKNFA